MRENKDTGDKIILNNSTYLKWHAGSIANDNLPEDSKIIIDGRTQLIEGYGPNGKKTGRIYNKFIYEGNWFNIPIGNEIIKPDEVSGITKINYNILYI